MGTQEELLLLADGGRDLLDQDNIPNENQSLTCFSCNAPMQGLYCHQCGNKNDNFRRSIISLMIEMFQNLTAFDGRIWRSLWCLLRYPGRMAREFADGARTRWTSPIRMFLATSLLLFGYIAATDTQIIALGALEKYDGTSFSVVNVGDNSGDSYDQKLLWFVKKKDLAIPPSEDGVIHTPQFLKDIQDDIANADSGEGLQEAISEIEDAIEDASTSIERRVLTETKEALEERLADVEALADTASTPETPSTPIAEGAEPPATDAPDINTIAQGSQINITGQDGETITLDDKGIARMYDQVLRHPEVINTQLNTKLKWAMFFMMPFAMFMGALFIRGRSTAMLYDHLVHAAYVHSFSFLLLFSFILLAHYTPAKGLLLPYTLILLIYLPISAKGAFKRGWFKSILTAYGVGSVYTLVMMITASIVLFGALSGIAKDVSEASNSAAVQTAPSTPNSTPEPASTPSGEHGDAPNTETPE